MTPAADDERPFKLLEKPVLRWSQPVRGGDDGAVFLWLDGRRPAAIGTIFAWPFGNGEYVVQHELHSLATEPLAARWRDRAFWAPQTAGVAFEPLADSPRPADTPTRRLTQMRSLARQFSARSESLEKQTYELRLLPQPLYRYAEPKADEPKENAPLDGALFAFVQGTDPEILMLIEARRHGDIYRWEFACARFSDYRLTVMHDGRERWTVGPGNPRPDAPHYYTAVERRVPPAAGEVKAKDAP
ncbi:MAG: hypothetical protein KY476_11600 [Planctomycetes bacterium]|nr:hypothetical protein [Planctomycetota bacterium]